MALGLPSSGGGGGERASVVKYDARAGRIFRLDRAQDSGGNWQTSQVEITSGFQAVMDLEGIEVGWLAFPAGAAPQMTLVKFGETLPVKPSDQHKSGFRVHMKLGKSSGGDVREMASNAGVSISAMDELHTAYVAEQAQHPGQLPVVALASTKPIVTQGKDAAGRPQSSTNYQPVWSIVKWVDRPAELAAPGAAPAATTPAPAAAPAAQPAPAAVAPAAAAPTPAPAKELVDADEF